jgi:hypothetical protein
MTIDPVNVVCPHCGIQSSHYIVMSGTIFRSEVYTDGRQDVLSGMHSTNPFIIRCRNCRGFYLFHEATREVDRRKLDQEFESLEYDEHHLTADDYFAFLKEMTGLDSEQELSIRMLFWRAVNDIIRWKKPDEAKLEEYNGWKAEMASNLMRLLELLEHEMEEDYLLPAVEICRELGQFEKARGYLKKIPKGRNASFVEFQKKLISKGDSAVHKIPSKS